MDIFLNILFLIIGFAALIFGANYFVDGATDVAKRLKIPTIIIGLTIVAIGTSLPELAVSITSAIGGSSQVSVGNVVGSNLANMLLILGVVAAIKSVPIDRKTQRFDLPFLIIIHFLLLIFIMDKLLGDSETNFISRSEGIVFLLLVVYYIITQIRSIKQPGEKLSPNELNTKPQEEPEKDTKRLKIWQLIIYIVGGLAGIVLGGECVSRTSQFLAIKAGMSEALVGVTIVALGTSLPELITSIISAKKGETELAVGNVIGSNIMNVLLISGSVATISQIPISREIFIDIIILFVATITFAICCYTKKKVRRFEGVILICLYFAYMAYAIIRNYA